MDAIVWTLSTAILVIGLINVPAQNPKWPVVVLLSYVALLNLIDWVIDGQLTIFRQYAYLSISVGVVAYALFVRRDDGNPTNN